MSLLLVRHGETALNAARVLQPADTPLSAVGLAQALAVAERLRHSGARALIASDLPRALQTAQSIAQATGLPVQTSQLLHERNFGGWRGQPYDALGFDPMHDDRVPPGGEAQPAFIDRCAQAWRMILELRATLDGPLIVVAHGLVIRQWLPEPRPKIDNTAVTIVQAQRPHAVELLNCTRHLQNDLAGRPGAVA